MQEKIKELVKIQKIPKFKPQVYREESKVIVKKTKSFFNRYTLFNLQNFYDPT
jgi:hypothetical protein